MIHVAVAVIFDPQGKVLIARRRPGTHMAGLWEFPGGKVEGDENVQAALRREIQEELGIVIHAARPLIQIHYRYPEKAVWLDVWRVESFEGTPIGCEGQEVQWVLPNQLADFQFPPANAPIISAINLPDIYLITEDPAVKCPHFLDELNNTLQSGIRLVQFRCKSLDKQQYKELARQAVTLCHQYGAQILLNERVDCVAELNADGAHLTSVQVMDCKQRPLSDDYWLSASVHNQQELARAHYLGVDFIVVSPVLSTPSHPAAIPLGWQGLKRLINEAAMPVYALGGMSRQDLATAFQAGAQGVAGISNFWVSNKAE